jgi:Glycosyl hydrolases family 25
MEETVTLFGPDGSHHQNPDNGFTVAGEDWGRINFLIWRCSIRDREDLTFSWARDQARKRGIALKAYHFVYPTNTGEWPAQSQARACLAALDNDTSIPVMLDWEQEKWFKKGKVVREFNPTFDDVVAVANAMRALGIKVVSLYTGTGYWGSQGSPTLAGHGLDLVNARWGSNPEAKVAADHYRSIGGDAGKGWQGFGGLEPVIWQFGSQISWGSQHMDHNAFRGNAAALHRWFKIWNGQPAKPPTAPAAKGRVPIDWMPDPQTTGGVATCPPTVDVLAGTVDTWWAIWAIKTIQRAGNVPVTGQWDQATAEASLRIR